jgi:hypothetical protein
MFASSVLPIPHEPSYFKQRLCLTDVEYVVSNKTSAVNCDLERVWKEAVAEYFNTLSQRSAGGTEKNDECKNRRPPTLESNPGDFKGGADMATDQT